MAGYMMMVLGAIALGGGITMAVGSMRVRAWPVTTGQLVEKRVELSKTAAASDPGAKYEAGVKYTYEVGGKSYTGEKVSTVTVLQDKDKVEKFIAELPERPQVHYNPQNPVESYLFPASLLWPGFAIIFGGIMLIIGAALLVAGKTQSQ